MAKTSKKSPDDSAPVNPKDYYGLLGIDKSASEDEIKKAYRKMAMKCHPDRNPGDAKAEETFKNVKAAYETLSDADKRASYDNFGADGPQGFNPGFSGFSGGQPDSMSDMFEQFFNQGQRSGRASRPAPAPAGQDILVQTQLSMEEAFAGKTITVAIPVEHDCTACDATGSKTRAAPTTCATCNGTGVVSTKAGGIFSMQHACPTCHGMGTAVQPDDACPVCHGKGRTKQTENIDVAIPAGVDSDMRVRMPGRGLKSTHPQGAPGDLFVDVQVKPHEVYQREEMDLHMALDVPWTTATLGGTQSITLLDGTQLDVNIPEGTQHGQVLRARGRGMPNPRNGNDKGNLLMHLHVTVPTSLTGDQKRLIKELNASFEKSPAKNQPVRTGWLGKAKDWLG